MWGFWKREHGCNNLTYRSRRHPAWMVMQYNRYRWYLGLDPEAPVQHTELLEALQIGEDQKLFDYPFRSPRHAKQVLRQALGQQGSQQDQWIGKQVQDAPHPPASKD